MLEKIDKKELAQLIKDGNIIGLVYGDSEVGPRALGNRSIVCDPNIKEMKDILNAKVKFREWYRPFAPFCKKEDASTYFDSNTFESYEYMSFAPRVKEEYIEKLPSITHVDNTARLQVVTEESHSHFYELLTEFGKISETNVLLNTSFNIRGYPILSTIEDALYVPHNTQMDYVVDKIICSVNDYGTTVWCILSSLPQNKAVYFALENFRKHFPENPIVLISDAGDDLAIMLKNLTASLICVRIISLDHL